MGPSTRHKCRYHPSASRCRSRSPDGGTKRQGVIAGDDHPAGVVHLQPVAVDWLLRHQSGPQAVCRRRQLGPRACRKQDTYGLDRRLIGPHHRAVVVRSGQELYGVMGVSP